MSAKTFKLNNIETLKYKEQKEANLSKRKNIDMQKH